MPEAERRPTTPPDDASRRTSGIARQVSRLKTYFREGWRAWVREFLEYRYLNASSLVLIVIATYLDYHAGVYVSATEGPDIPDLILDHFGPIDLSPLFVYGYIALVCTLFISPLVFHIRTFHFVASQFSLLVMLRSVFMLFTHLQTPSDAIRADFPWICQHLSFQNDMFFSGHTAIPLLGFFLFKHSPLRYVFLAGSLIMAFTVLAMHLHYSIDVFGAFFITYCSYRMGCALTKKIDATFHE